VTESSEMTEGCTLSSGKLLMKLQFELTQGTDFYLIWPAVPVPHHRRIRFSKKYITLHVWGATILHTRFRPSPLLHEFACEVSPASNVIYWSCKSLKCLWPGGPKVLLFINWQKVVESFLHHPRLAFFFGPKSRIMVPLGIQSTCWCQY